MYGMSQLSDHILHVAHIHNCSITNLHLQKVMFFSLGFHIRSKGFIDALAEATYDIPFDRRQYGPCVERIYYSHCQYRGQSIEDKGKRNSIYSEWDETIVKLLMINQYDLVRVSTGMKSFINYKEDIFNKKFVPRIELSEFLEDFL